VLNQGTARDRLGARSRGATRRRAFGRAGCASCPPGLGLAVRAEPLFGFLVNLRTAQALGLTSTLHALLQATEVIQ